MPPQTNSPKQLSNWMQITMISLILLALWFTYIALERAAFDVYSLNQALAVNAFVLTGLSMVLASLAYFWKGFQRQIVYRVNLGVVGFFYGLIHAILSIYFYGFDRFAPQPNYEFGKIWPILGSFQVSNVVAFIFGVLALLIFGVMAIISIKSFILKIGALRWRKLLRYLGYTALSLVLLHFLIKSFNIWVNPQNWNFLPPLSLSLWIFGTAILALRLAMEVQLRKKKTANV